jgi:hypothetical protein
VTQQTESHKNAPVLPLDFAVRVCDNVNMTPRIAAICAIVAFATCGGRALAQFPDCAHISTEAQGECAPAQEVYLVNDHTDGQVTVTIHVAMIDTPSVGTITSTDRVLTLAAGERQSSGVFFSPRRRDTHGIL